MASWGLSVNVALVLVKLAGGAATHSAALIADAVNSIGDVAGAVAVHGALHVAQRAEDEDHPYGHTKAESIAGLSISLLVVFTALALGVETLRSLGDVASPPSVWAGILAALCALVKEAIYRYTRRTADVLHSAALRAAAWDHRGDALASGAVAAALLIAPLLGDAAPYVDPIAAIGVCILLVAVGGRMFAQTAAELMDQQAGDELTDAIRRQARQTPHVSNVEKLRVRKSGLEYFVEIHVQVEGHLTVHEGHRIGHAVKDRLLKSHPRIRDVHVHIEPAGPAGPAAPAGPEIR